MRPPNIIIARDFARFKGNAAGFRAAGITAPERSGRGFGPGAGRRETGGPGRPEREPLDERVYEDDDGQAGHGADEEGVKPVGQRAGGSAPACRQNRPTSSNDAVSVVANMNSIGTSVIGA